VSSPLARAVQTAAPLAARLGRQPIVDDRFGALRVGYWEGLSEDEIAERWPEQWQRWRSEPHALEVEGREILADPNARVAGALEQLFAELVDGRVAVVFTHDAGARRRRLGARHRPRDLSARRGRQLLDHHGRSGRRCAPAAAEQREVPP
jgi:glucosyl-3-phosphoglycerate phosphatase